MFPQAEMFEAFQVVTKRQDALAEEMLQIRRQLNIVERRQKESSMWP